MKNTSKYVSFTTPYIAAAGKSGSVSLFFQNTAAVGIRKFDISRITLENK